MSDQHSQYQHNQPDTWGPHKGMPRKYSYSGHNLWIPLAATVATAIALGVGAYILLPSAQDSPQVQPSKLERTINEQKTGRSS